MEREEIFKRFQQLSYQVRGLGCIAQNDWTEFPIDKEFTEEWEIMVQTILKEIDSLKLATLKEVNK